MVVILTDGQENASTQFNRQRVFDLIGDKTKEGWTFVYLGANQDAFTEAANLGIVGGNTLSYTADSTGIAAATASLSQSTASYMASAASNTATASNNTNTTVTAFFGPPLKETNPKPSKSARKRLSIQKGKNPIT